MPFQTCAFVGQRFTGVNVHLSLLQCQTRDTMFLEDFCYVVITTKSLCRGFSFVWPIKFHLRRVTVVQCSKGMCYADTNVGRYCKTETLKQATGTEKVAGDNQTALTPLKAFSLTVVLLYTHRIATTALLSAFKRRTFSEFFFLLANCHGFLVMFIIVAFDLHNFRVSAHF